MSDISALHYPVSLGIAYILLFGCVLRAIFVWLHLPASVGVMLSGFIFRYVFQNELLGARDELQELAFFLVLLTAGLEIRVEHLKVHIFVMAIVPAAFEICGIALYACGAMQYTPVEGLVLGSVLAALGDGLVIPKMQEFSCAFEGHALPRMVSTWAPVEASFVLTTFGVLAGLASPEDGTTSLSIMVLSNLLRLVATLLVGMLFGAVCALFINVIDAHDVSGLFRGTPSERLLMLLAATLWAFSLGQGAEGKEWVPMGFAPGSMFQPELLVIVTGACFAKISDEQILHDIEAALREVWTFGQIFLFSMLGSKITPDLLPELRHVLPVMLCGLLFRLLGVTLGLLVTRQSRGRPDTMLPDTLFCFLCTLPRATIQGALGAKPKKLHFFSSGTVSAVSSYIFTAAQLYILCYSVTGMVLLHTLGPKLLEWSSNVQKSLESATGARMQQISEKREGAERESLLDPEALRAANQGGNWTTLTEDTARRDAFSTTSTVNTVHGFEAHQPSYQPRLLAREGRKETPDAVMLDGWQPQRGDVVVRALRPQKFVVKANQGVQEVETIDGKVSVDTDAAGSKDSIEFNFGPAPDYMLRAPWSSTTKIYKFQKANGVLRVPVPAKQTRVFVVPKALMLEIPDDTTPGAELFFTHPDRARFPGWFTTRLPKNWQVTKRYLPVRLPKEEYQFDGSVGGDFFLNMSQEVSLIIEEICEALDRIWRWLQQCCWADRC